MSTWREFAGADGAGAGTADALSARMQQAWASFVADGVPYDDRAGPWPVGRLVELGPAAGVGDDDVAARLRVWLGEAPA